MASGSTRRKPLHVHSHVHGMAESSTIDLSRRKGQRRLHLHGSVIFRCLHAGLTRTVLLFAAVAAPAVLFLVHPVYSPSGGALLFDLAWDPEQVRQELWRNPAVFPDRIRFSKRCSNDRQQAWEDAIQYRYDEKLTETGRRCMDPALHAYGPSGPGSSLNSTEPLRRLLPQLFEELSITTFMDCPCGDWLWMQTVDLTGIQYFGADITQVTVDRNNECFRTSNVHFHTFDLTCMIPPPVDLILVRDALFHMPEDTVVDVLSNINHSGARFLATTTFSTKRQGVFNNQSAYKETKDRHHGFIGMQVLNLYGPPYFLPQPLYMADESEAVFKGRHVGVWELPLPPPDQTTISQWAAKKQKTSVLKGAAKKVKTTTLKKAPTNQLPKTTGLKKATTKQLPKTTLLKGATKAQPKTTLLKKAATKAQPKTTLMKKAATKAQPKTALLKKAATKAQPMSTVLKKKLLH